MKTIKKVTAFFFIILPIVIRAEPKEIPFTLDDRDRIIRTEQKVETINQRFDTMDKRFDQLFNFFWAFIGIFTAMMVSVFGFAFWDRNLSLASMNKENE